MTPPKTARTAASMPNSAFLGSAPLLVTAAGELDVELEPVWDPPALEALVPDAELDEVATLVDVDDATEDTEVEVLVAAEDPLEDGAADDEVDAGAELEDAGVVEADAEAAVAAQAQTAAALDWARRAVWIPHPLITQA